MYENNFSIIKKTSKLRWLFDLPNTGKGSIGSSDAQGKGDFYYQLEEKGVEALYIKKGEIIQARALLWNLDKIGAKHNLPGSIFLDRIFYSEKEELNLLKNYADKKGFVRSRNHIFINRLTHSLNYEEFKFSKNLKALKLYLNLRKNKKSETI